MTLRFFRRKTGTSDAAAGDGAAPKETNDSEASPKRTTRRRGSSTSRAKKTTTEERTTTTQTPKSTSERITTTQPTTSTSKTRRGRRGGVGRNSRAKAEAAAKAAARPQEVEQEAPKTSSRRRSTSTSASSSDGATIETFLQKQEAALDQQLTVMKGLQGSLAAIEHRIGGDRPGGAPVDQARVGIFVDVPNIMYAAERLRVKLDYGKVLHFILRGRELARASAYAPISDDPQAKLETQKFVEPFVDLGYRVVTKPLKRFADGSMKGNFDVELAIDVLTMSDRLDVVSLVSGDGDFRRLVEIVQSKGVRVEVIAFGPSTAAELRAVADEYVDFEDHLKELKATR